MEGTCPILGRITPRTVVDSRNHWTLVRCQETGFVYLQDPPDYTALVEEYAWEKTCEEEKIRRQTDEPWVARLSEMAKSLKFTLFPNRQRFDTLTRSTVARNPSPRFLDIGCGYGKLLTGLCRRYQQRGISVVPHGIEISRRLAAKSQKRFAEFGGSVVFAAAMEGLSQLDEKSFDVVILSSFLEHESNPLDLLGALRRVVRDDGVVILKVPNYACWNRKLRGKKWCGYRFPDHVNYFTPETLRILAETADYRVRQRLWDRLPLSDNMYAVLSKAA